MAASDKARRHARYQLSHAQFPPPRLPLIDHGRYRGKKAYVILEADDGRARPVGERSFCEFFLGIPDARLAVLNACQTAIALSARPPAGLSLRILQRNLSAIVAMQYPISDDAALIFSREFYRSLPLGYPVDAAMAEAHKGIFLEVDSSRRRNCPEVQCYCQQSLKIKSAQGITEPFGHVVPVGDHRDAREQRFRAHQGSAEVSNEL